MGAIRSALELDKARPMLRTVAYSKASKVGEADGSAIVRRRLGMVPWVGREEDIVAMRCESVRRL